jgi:ethanolamine-phosphate cytidylyltransferase
MGMLCLCYAVLLLQGISTTDIVGRMLLMTRAHHKQGVRPGGGSLVRSGDFPPPNPEMKSQFLTTSRVIRLFGAGVKAPPKDCTIVYLAGSWDMFHSGHNRALEQARRFGDYLIVGVHSDSEVRQCGSGSGSSSGSGSGSSGSGSSLIAIVLLV